VPRDGVGQAGRTVRWLLLACTLFGLAAMHTIGHAGMRHGASDHSPAMVVAMSGTTSAESAADGLCDGGCAHGPGSAPHGGMAGWSVCLAVLGAVATLILLAMLVAPSRRRQRPASVADPWAVVSRGPPVRPAGLALAAVSVLRI
jgi:hypothetical protein